MTASEQAPSLMRTDFVEKTLRALTRELARESVHEPPSDEAIDRWQQRAEALRKSLQDTELPGRNRLLRTAGRFLGDVEDVRQRKARYLAARESLRPTLIATERDGWPEGPRGVPRRLLAASIHAGLEAGRQAGTARGNDAYGADARFEEPGAEVPTVEKIVLSDEVSEARDVSPPPAPAERRPAPARPVIQARSAPVANAHSILPSRRMSRRLDPIIAVAGRLARPGSFSQARDIALDWLKRKRFVLPDNLTDVFELRTPQGHTATSVSLPERGVWALQAETVDRNLEGRRWRVEMVLLDAAPTPAVSVTLTAISPGGSPEAPTSVPQLVTQLVDGIGLLDASDGSALNAGPVSVDRPDALLRVLASLRSGQRTRPALVLSTYRKDDQFKQLLDPVGLSRKMAGLAQVYVLSRDMGWPFNEAVGKDTAVAGASVRMFRPGFSVDDPSGRHPLWSPTELTAQGLGLNGLSDTLLREAAYLSLRALEREDAIPPFDRVREMVLKRQIEEARDKVRAASLNRRVDDDSASLRQALNSEIELRKLFEEDNEQLQEELARTKLERNEARDQRDTLSGKLLYLEGRVQELSQQLQEDQAPGEPYFPDSWDDLEDWCEEHLAGRVVLTPKALRSARNSRYLDIPFAYRVLWFLAEHYVPARRNGGEGYRDGLAEMGLELSPVGRSASDRRSRETYSTDYRNERVALDWHVKGSNDRDRRYGFRIYYHWHVRDQCLVVGSLPEHLDNVLS